VKAALEDVHPKFHFSATMARSMVFLIVIGSIEFVWVMIMYLSVPQWWHSAVAGAAGHDPKCHDLDSDGQRSGSQIGDE